MYDRRLKPKRFLFRWNDDPLHFRNLVQDQERVRALARQFLKEKPRLDALRPETTAGVLSPEQRRTLEDLGYGKGEDADGENPPD